MNYKRQKPKAQQQHRQRDTGNLYVSFRPKLPSAWDIWQSLTPEQQAQLNDLTRRAIAAEMDRLRNHVDYICDCELRPATTSGAINWGDLGCVAAAFSVNSNGDVFQQVFVEEADPVNPELHAAIRAACLRDGWGDVEVITEW